MEAPKSSFLRSALHNSGVLAGKLWVFLGLAARQTRVTLIKLWKHPKVSEAREICRDLSRDLLELRKHPKVAEYRERLQDRLAAMRDQPEHPAVTRFRETVHPPYIILAAGTIVAICTGTLATQALRNSQRIQTSEITREAGLQIKKMRLEENSEAVDSWRGEQEKLQRALKALERSRSSGTSFPDSTSLANC